MAAIKVHTPALYRGLPVTVVGRDDTALIAIAACATPLERALGIITAKPNRSGQRYYVTGHTGTLATLEEAARLVAQLREARDRGAGTRRPTSAA
jgi:hypothetical protein